ncbi:MAG: DMT family transporter, partial [Sphingomonas parapaucimobilis]
MSEFDTAPRSTHAAVLIPFAIVTLIWGSTWLVIRDQISVVPATWSVSYRFLVGGLAMGAFALAKRESFRLGTTGLLFAAGIGLFQFVLNFNFVYHAEGYITSGLVAVVFAMLLIPNAGFARLFLGQRMGRQLLVGSAIALTGIALTIVAILSASTANVMQATRTAKRFPMHATLSVAMLIGSALDAVIAYSLNGPPVFEMRTGYVLGILYLGLFASALAFPLYYRVLRAIGPAKAAY